MAPWKSIFIYTKVSAEGLVVLENFAECSARLVLRGYYRAIFHYLSSRTHNRIRSSRLAASGLFG